MAFTATAFFSQAIEAKRAWLVVPGFKYIFVDEASIHRDRPPRPPGDDIHLRPRDTTADIKIDGRTYPAQKFWCVPFGQVQFGPLGAGWPFTVLPPKIEPKEGRFPKAAMDAVERVVCADFENAAY